MVAVFFLSDRLAGVPFVPFRLFDGLTRLVPGAVITFGIDAMVSVIRGLGIGRTSAVAKLAEQAMAISALLLAGIAGAAAMFAALRRREPRGWAWPGLALGSLVGVPVAVIVSGSGRANPIAPVLDSAWTLAVFWSWGLALAWIRRRLATPPTVIDSDDVGVQRLDRRRFMIQVAGAAATITVAGAGLATTLLRRHAVPDAEGAERWSATHPLPNADSAIVPAEGTRPELTPLEQHYRIDINTASPEVDPRGWRLRIGGLVEHPRELTLDQLRDNYPPTHQFVTLACISNRVAGDLTGTTRWTGVSLQRLLDDAGPRPNATHLRIRGADGFHETVALDAVRADPRVMLAYAWDGVPLTREHGFPLRIYVPDRYGMKQPKWIESIEVTDRWDPGYWVRRGWDREARMRATSVIDTVGVDMRIIDGDRRGMRIPIGGIAHAGARGVSRVEVRVDDGPWERALLREPLSGTTWVIWRYDWPFRPGKHTFTVRCFESSGAPQIASESPPHPSGATGLHHVDEML